MDASGTGAGSSHWTYRKPEGDLAQGDILKKTSAIEAMLEEVHKHYKKDDYSHFLVLTQSCDLVLRTDGRKSRYITLAAIRPLELALKRFLQKNQASEFERAANVCSLKHKGKASEFLTKLFNNNEPSYFYLHEDAALGLSPNSCAFLQLSIAIKTDLHYQTCLDARIASMTDIFAAKLGWLVGNLYSRVGTEDWTPTHQTSTEFSNRIAATLDAACKWFDDEQLKNAVKAAPPDLKGKSETDLLAHLANHKLPPKRERLLTAMQKVLVDSVGGDVARATRILADLKSDPDVAALIRTL